MFPITIRKIMLLFYWIGETEMGAWTDLYNWLKDVGMNIFDIRHSEPMILTLIYDTGGDLCHAVEEVLLAREVIGMFI